MRTDCIVKLSKLQISELNTLVQKETSGDVEGNHLLRTHIIHGPLTRRARVNFSSDTFDYCFVRALVRPTTKLADLPSEPRNYKQFLNHPAPHIGSQRPSLTARVKHPEESILDSDLPVEGSCAGRYEALFS
jgi:hypothetical protein